MQRQSLGIALALCLVGAWLASPSAAAETLYQPGEYLDAPGGAPSCGAASYGAPCGGCADPCCESCCCSACCGWYGGVEAFWAQPRIKDNIALTRYTAGGVAANQNALTTRYDYDYDVTPRIWLGYADACGFGVRGSWWKYEDDANPQDVVLGDGNFSFLRTRLFPGDELSFDPDDMFRGAQALKLEQAEVEVTNCFDLCCGGCALVSYGIRYVSYASETREEADIIVAQFRGYALDSFDGVGPTLALEFNQPLNCRWSVYGKLRGTVAFGQRDVFAVAGEFEDGEFFADREVSRSDDESMAIGELEVGLQWNYCCWFARGGWRTQYWDDAMVVAPLGDVEFPAHFGTRGDISVQGVTIAVGYAR